MANLIKTLIDLDNPTDNIYPNILGSNIPAGAITDDKIAGNSITGVKIQDNTIAGSKLLDNSITDAKIQDDAVTNSKINDGAVTTPKINDGAVTLSKLGFHLYIHRLEITITIGADNYYLRCNMASTSDTIIEAHFDSEFFFNYFGDAVEFGYSEYPKSYNGVVWLQKDGLGNVELWGRIYDYDHSAWIMSEETIADVGATLSYRDDEVIQIF